MSKREALIRSEIKTACDILRTDDGTSGATDYIEQLSWLLFLKVFEGVEEELEEIAILNGEEYIPVIDKKYRWSNWAKRDWIGKPKECLKEFVDDVDEEFKKIDKPENAIIHFINNILFPYLRNLSGTPEREKVAQIFMEISGNKMKSPYNLMDVIEKIDKIDPRNYEDTQVLSQIYEEILLNMGSEAGWSGEFYTPRPVIRFIVKIIKPKVGEKIFDPFGGSAGFLVEAYKYIKDKLGDKITVQEEEILQRETFYGHEKKPLPYLLGTMNMILHGILTPNYYRRNSLMEDVHNVPEHEKYDVIMTNPPFGGKENKIVQNNFPYPVQATEALALQYIMRKLKDGGRAAVILPEGQIMFGGGKFKEIRRELLEKFNVFAIVSLPQGVFSQMGAGVKTNIVFFEKSGEPTKEIWYYELEGKFTKKNKIKDKDFEDALKKFEKREISENSWIVSIEEIKKRDYDLTPKNPNKKEEIEYREPEEILKEIEEVDLRIEGIIKKIKSML
ncbi:class I SAM-dependent DNA methyltransferase [Methanocaldococcus fervens]|uniref:site-specific DNA-methyltransferase (adenine-specific) n=1 Tax=Methanocaldococcus fervens (strain DSM 4213 / JCM 15782 / AG86) TaxID=573064 RepID=C7P6B0_METFA|nr:N-6 DNA methylase [Methanocaldococcus fervens]ACV24092.1 N-6 DNA methylase [Methanocaldococcus fervens AG86]